MHQRPVRETTCQKLKGRGGFSSNWWAEISKNDSEGKLGKLVGMHPDLRTHKDLLYITQHKQGQSKGRHKV